ncbi:MAG: TIR domain-containing protein [Chloroflexota bacterium]
MARVEKTVFISYRRKDISWALAVYQYLTGQRYDVFFDYSSIPSGDFEQIIVSNIKARAHFILILTPTALDRCDEPNDWLRREIEIAVNEKRNIVPLFFDGFNFSSPSITEKLTGGLGVLKRYNGLDIPPGYFGEAMERLRSRYLNIVLTAVIHPVSAEVGKVVREEQIAANKALAQKHASLEGLIQPGPWVAPRRIWIYGRLVVVLLLLSGFFGPWAQLSACTGSSTAPTVYRGIDVFRMLSQQWLIIIPAVLGASFLFALMRLLPWRFAGGRILVQLERLAAGFALLGISILGYLIGIWRWGLWVTWIGAVLAPLNLLLEFNSTRQKGDRWPLWAWLLVALIVLSVSILVLFWVYYKIAQSTL